MAPNLDEETAAALTLYNTYLVADREQQAHERALRKAEKAKDDAAAAVRKLNDRKAPASETAAAETTYRDAVAALQRLRDGDTVALKDQDDATGDDTAGDDTAGDDAEATLGGDVPTTEDTGGAAASDRDTATKDPPTDEPQTASEESTDETQTASEESTDETQTASQESTDETSSVGVETSVGDDDLAGDEPAGVAG